ncbi:MAG: DNA gyrase inhibitor YacG [Sphingomonas adhaesiva]|uniref:DNA gyrase inhibitor YacG n=1 Tax=Sphingomonas adhaesiva TaxID=28212 RepID=UPI002FF78571
MKNACPICRAPTDPAHTPFCSRGCKDRDLLQWLGEGYRIPGPSANDTEGLDSARDTD